MTKAKTTEVARQPKRHLLFAPEGATPTDEFEFWIVGNTPLIVHAWSQKAKLEMLNKQLKATKAGRDARDPEQDYRNSLYAMGPDPEASPNGYGFPITGLKKAIVQSAHKSKGIARTEVLGALWLNGEMIRVGAALAGAICDMPLGRLYASPPEMREDMVKIGVGLSKTASLAYRGQFTDWAIKVSGQLNTAVVTIDQLMFLIRESGLAQGVGEWRNEKSGVFGSYHLATAKEAGRWEKYAVGEGPLPVRFDSPALMAAE